MHSTVIAGIASQPTALMTYFIFTAYSRYLHRDIYPKLSAALRPLKPGPAEIKLVLWQLGQRKLKVASAVKPEKLMQWMAQKN